MKNKKYLLLILIAILFGFSFYFINKNIDIQKDLKTKEASFTIDKTQPLYSKYSSFGNEQNNVYKTKDNNIINLFNTYFNKNNSMSDDGFSGKYIDYYNDNVFLFHISSYSSSINLFSIKTGERINKCTIVDQLGNYRDNKIIFSGYHEGEESYSKKLCFYEYGADNFKIIDLSDKMKEGEGFDREIEPISGSEFVIKKVDYDKRIITISTFDQKSLDSKGINTFKYIRDIEFSY